MLIVRGVQRTALRATQGSAGRSVEPNAPASCAVHPRLGADASRSRLASPIPPASVRQADGVPPTNGSMPPSKRHLSTDERKEILAGIKRGASIRQIATHLGRAPSTVLRELRRNLGEDSKAQNYRPGLAQERAKRMASRPKATKLAMKPVLRDLVQARLLEGLSPKQISGELKKQFPHDPAMRVSHETIYRSIYIRGRGALRTSRRKRA